MIRRAFLAFPLPPDVQSAIGKAIYPLQHLPLRFVPGPSLHITLLFLGDTEIETLGSFCSRLQPTVAGMRSPYIAFTHIAPSRTGSMLWAHGTTTDALKEMHAFLRTEAHTAGYHTEARPFTMHATVARSTKHTSLHIRKVASVPLTVSFRPAAISVLSRARGESPTRYEQCFLLPFHNKREQQ